jgi:hypothetical protein
VQLPDPLPVWVEQIQEFVSVNSLACSEQDDLEHFGHLLEELSKVRSRADKDGVFAVLERQKDLMKSIDR